MGSDSSGAAEIAKYTDGTTTSDTGAAAAAATATRLAPSPLRDVPAHTGALRRPVGAPTLATGESDRRGVEGNAAEAPGGEEDDYFDDSDGRHSNLSPDDIPDKNRISRLSLDCRILGNHRCV